MRKSIIVAMSRNRVIGRDHGLPWHLPGDLKYFKALTMGHPLIVGRKTFESIGRVLPGRTMIVVTRTKSELPGGVIAVSSLEDAWGAAAGSDEAFIGGGVEIYRQTFPIADRLYLTLVHETFEGDAFFPEFSEREWSLVLREDREADAKNPYAYSFLTYERVTI